MIRILLLSLVVCLISAACRAQKPLDLGFAFGPSFGENLTSGGFAWTLGVGVQRPIGNGRFRHHPNLTYGRYFGRGSFVVLGESSEFDSFSIRYDINFDVVKVRNFSFFVGGGLGANRSSGWEEVLSLNTKGLYKRSPFKHSAFFHSFLGGIRIKPERGPFGEVSILNAERGFERRYERKLGLDLKKGFGH
ncbi:MAG: hypothetical protein GDA42_09785 [Ekhidna sp.]|nr:hypothetical protein [Ekhidna sp.]